MSHGDFWGKGWRGRKNKHAKALTQDSLDTEVIARRPTWL